MVLHKQGDQLYTGVKDVIYEHLSELVDSKIVPALPKSVEGPIIGATELAGGSEFLHLLKISWEDHTTCMGMIKDILMYVVRISKKFWFFSHGHGLVLTHTFTTHTLTHTHSKMY